MDGLDFFSDPVVVTAVAATTSILLMISGAGKLRDITVFRYAVENYRLLNSQIAAVFAPAFALAELAAGIALVFENTRVYGAMLGLALILLATLAVVINLLRGVDSIECGCGGEGQRISWGLVLRNICLSLLLSLAAGEQMPRALSMLDFVSVAGAVLALLALYASANQLLANQPFLKGLQS